MELKSIRQSQGVAVDGPTVAASGSGEINVIDTPNDASTGWEASGAGITVETTTTAAHLPLSPMITTAIRIVPVSGTDYVRFRFRVPPALRARMLKFEWEQLPAAGYASGDLKVEIHTNDQSDYSGSYTKLVLTDQDENGDVFIPSVTGRVSPTFSTDNVAEFYEVRFVRVSGTEALNIASVICGPGIQPKGAVVEDLGDIGVTFSFGGATTTCVSNATRVGEYLECYFLGVVTDVTGISSNPVIQLPSSYPIDQSNMDALASGSSSSIGWCRIADVSAASSSRRKNASLQLRDGSFNEFFIMYDNGSGGENFANSTNPMTWENGDKVHGFFRLRITSWIGSGTVNLGSNNPVFLSHDGSNTIYGPNGSLVPNVSFGTGFTSRSMTLPRPLQAGEVPKVYISNAGNGFTENFYPYSTGNNANIDNAYGIRVLMTNPTTVRVDFGNQGTRVSSSSANNGDTSWSVTNGLGTRFLVVIEKAGLAVGFGKATPTSSGLITSYAPTVKSSVLTVTDANYTIQDLDGYSTILVSTGASNRTITLPAAANNAGREITIKKIDSGTGQAQIVGTIDGGTANNNILAQYGYATVISNGSAWLWKQDIQENGTWVPALSFSSSNGTATTGVAAGFYQRHGRSIVYNFRLQFTDAANNASGDLRVSGFPYTSENATNNLHRPSVSVETSFTLATNGYQVVGQIGANASIMGLFQLRNGQSAIAINDTHIGTGATEVIASGTYRIGK